MTVYLCAAFGRQASMRRYRELLAAVGIGVRACWLDAPAEPPVSVTAQGIAANQCLVDIRGVDAVLAFTEAPDEGTYYTGGRHVEVGAALAWGIPVFVIGPVENVFHCHRGVIRCRDIGDALLHLLPNGVEARA